MTREQQVKIFIADLRRVLYMAQIFRAQVDDLRNNELCPYHVKNPIKSIFNATNVLIRDIRLFAQGQGTWEAVRHELSKDELHDLSALLESTMDVANVAEIVEVINECKVTVEEK